MNQPNAANLQALVQYTKVNIQTGVENASPYRLIQMLFDGAMARIATARNSFKQGDVTRKGENICSAISIIGGLRDSLDHEVGGEIVTNLEDLYSYMTERLLQANINNDMDIMNEVYDLLMQIKTAWDEIGNLQEAQALQPGPVMGQTNTG